MLQIANIHSSRFFKISLTKKIVLIAICEPAMRRKKTVCFELFSPWSIFRTRNFYRARVKSAWTPRDCGGEKTSWQIRNQERLEKFSIQREEEDDYWQSKYVCLLSNEMRKEWVQCVYYLISVFAARVERECTFQQGVSEEYKKFESRMM